MPSKDQWRWCGLCRVLMSFPFYVWVHIYFSCLVGNLTRLSISIMTEFSFFTRTYPLTNLLFYSSLPISHDSEPVCTILEARSVTSLISSAIVHLIIYICDSPTQMWERQMKRQSALRSNPCLICWTPHQSARSSQHAYYEPVWCRRLSPVQAVQRCGL